MRWVRDIFSGSVACVGGGHEAKTYMRGHMRDDVSEPTPPLERHTVTVKHKVNANIRAHPIGQKQQANTKREKFGKISES